MHKIYLKQKSKLTVKASPNTFIVLSASKNILSCSVKVIIAGFCTNFKTSRIEINSKAQLRSDHQYNNLCCKLLDPPLGFACTHSFYLDVWLQWDRSVFNFYIIQ